MNLLSTLTALAHISSPQSSKLLSLDQSFVCPPLLLVPTMSFHFLLSPPPLGISSTEDDGFDDRGCELPTSIESSSISFDRSVSIWTNEAEPVFSGLDRSEKVAETAADA
jgi:hypothetical protein